ncbi:MAG TPA: hypothetical protein GXZ82_02400 [Firmicutes bacterium]|jgi:hypothetical protein|nr:hypothetical protein [Bacillota bacterium]
MEKDLLDEFAGEVSPDQAYRLGMMVGKMIEAGLGAAMNWSIDVNLQAFNNGMRAGLNGTDLAKNPLLWRPRRKLRVKAKRARLN